MTLADSSIHASAVMVGDDAVLIRGASGSGKSRLALNLILAGRAGMLPRTTLIGDDRVRLSAQGGRVLVHSVPELHGMIEIRGLGIRQCDAVSAAPVGLVVDLDAPDAARLPPPETLRTSLLGIDLPRIPVASGWESFPLVAGFLTTT